MEGLAALVGFAFVSSVTPGPNNVLLWVSGASFGLRRTGPHILGTAVGLGLMALAAAAGLAALIAAIPALALVLKVGGSLYLLVLAYRIARSTAIERTELARPLGLVQAVVFQALNPKAWIFALGAVTTFRPAGASAVVGSLLVAGTMMVVIVPTATLWAAAGGALNRLLTDDRRRRIVSVVLAALVVATVISVWL
jgi:threonine/homoserine/homoserine lactone efflux protein